MVRDVHAVDDLLQEVFCRAWQARDRYAEQGTARAYLLRIADRLICDRGRVAQRERPMNSEQWEQLEPAADDEPPLGTLLEAESRQQLTEARRTVRSSAADLTFAILRRPRLSTDRADHGVPNQHRPEPRPPRLVGPAAAAGGGVRMSDSENNPLADAQLAETWNAFAQLARSAEAPFDEAIFAARMSARLHWKSSAINAADGGGSAKARWPWRLRC